MAPRSDDDLLPEALICELVDCPQPTRHSWVKRRLLDRRSAGCRLVDAVELLVLGRLMALIGPRDTGFVWADVRQALRDVTLTGEVGDVVIDLKRKTAVVVQDADSLVRAVRTEGPVRVIPIAADVRRLREDFRRLAGARGSEKTADTKRTSRRAPGHQRPV